MMEILNEYAISCQILRIRAFAH
ncbi:MAG: hypothetical protein ACD_4C00163G0003, partial [uncultured bacterium (gcode 4)]